MFYAAPNFLKMGINYLNLSSWTISTIKDEKSAAKFHYTKTASVKVVAQSIAFRATCRRFDTIPACDRRTDRQTDGIAVASTALAMPALRRAVTMIAKC